MKIANIIYLYIGYDLKTKTIILFAVFLLFALCINEGKTQVRIDPIDSTSLYSYRWTLFKMPGVKMYEVDNSRIPNLLFFPGRNGKFIGSGVCNDIEGQIKLSEKNKIQFSAIREEIYNCPNDLDPKFISMLRNVRYYKIQNDLLKFFDKDGNLLGKFWAEFTHEAYNVRTALEGEWIQNSLKKPKGWHNLKLLDTLPRISFSKTTPGVLSGFTGCNSFTSRFTLNNYQINFTQIQTFQDDPCGSDIEENFKSYLDATTMFWLGDELLMFWQGNSLVMDFLRAKDLRLDSGPVWRFLEKKRKRTIYVCPVGNEEIEE